VAIVEGEAVRGRADWPRSSVLRVRRVDIDGRMVEVWWGMTRGKIAGVKGTPEGANKCKWRRCE
jgi:hypothetical protein